MHKMCSFLYYYVSKMAVSATLLSLLGGLLYAKSVGKLTAKESRDYGIKRMLEIYIHGGTYRLHSGFRNDFSDGWVQQCLRIPIGPAGSVFDAIESYRKYIRTQDDEALVSDTLTANWLDSMYHSPRVFSPRRVVEVIRLGISQFLVPLKEPVRQCDFPGGFLLLPTTGSGSRSGASKRAVAGKQSTKPTVTSQESLAARTGSKKRAIDSKKKTPDEGSDSGDSDDDGKPPKYLPVDGIDKKKKKKSKKKKVAKKMKAKKVEMIPSTMTMATVLKTWTKMILIYRHM